MPNSEVSQKLVWFCIHNWKIPFYTLSMMEFLLCLPILKDTLSYLFSSGIEGRNRKQRFSFPYRCSITQFCVWGL